MAMIWIDLKCSYFSNISSHSIFFNNASQILGFRIKYLEGCCNFSFWLNLYFLSAFLCDVERVMETINQKHLRVIMVIFPHVCSNRSMFF